MPLALAPGLYFFDITPKLLLLVIGACLLWTVAAWDKTAHPLPRELAWLLGAQALLAVAATLLSSHRGLSLWGSEWRRMGLPATLACLAVAAAAAALVAPEARRRRRLLATTAGAGALVALYCLAQYGHLDPWIDPALYTIGEGEWAIVRPPGTLGYVSYAATYLLYVLFASAGLWLAATRAWEKAAWGLAATAAALALLVSGSRGAWLGAAVGTLLVLSGLGRRRAVLAGLLGLTVLAAVFVLSPYGLPVRSRLRWFVEDPQGGARLLLWRDSLRMIRGHLLLGAGLETFERAFPPFQSTELAQRFPDRYFESPHNVVLDYLTTTGAAGALAFVLLAVLALRNYLRGARHADSEEERLLARSLLAATAAALVSGQFIADTIPTRLYFLVFAALSFSWGQASSPRRPQGRLPPRRAIAVVALACLAFLSFYGFRLLQADRAMDRARAAASAGDLDTLLERGRAARQAFPWGGAYAMAFSRVLGRLAMKARLAPASQALLVALAEENARAALDAVPSPQLAAVHLASLCVLQGRWAEAEQALAAAIRAAPEWYRPHWLLAELLSQQGRRSEAAGQARLALLLGGREHPDVLQRCLAIEKLSSP